MTYRVILIVLLTVCASFITNSQTSQREYALKSGLIFNFALYSQTLNSELADLSHYVICSSSKLFVEVAQKTLANKKVKQRNVRVIYLTPNEMTESTCHIMFFNNNNTYDNYITSQRKKIIPSMLIGEMPNFIDLGGHINFIQVSGKIRFEINPEQLQANGIKVSSKVIRLGKIKKLSNL